MHPPIPTPTPSQPDSPADSVEASTVPRKRRYTLAKTTVTYEEVLEWIKIHQGGCPRQMCKSRKDFANRMVYFFLFAEVHRRYPRRVRTEWKTIGDGLGYPSRQLHYYWVF